MNTKKTALLGAAALAFMSEGAFAKPENKVNCNETTEVTGICADVKSSVENTNSPILKKRAELLKVKMTELKYKPIQDSDGFIISTDYAENAFVVFPTIDGPTKEDAYFINCYAHESKTVYFKNLDEVVDYIKSVQKEAPYGFYLHSGDFPPGSDEQKSAN